MKVQKESVKISNGGSATDTIGSLKKSKKNIKKAYDHLKATPYKMMAPYTPQKKKYINSIKDVMNQATGLVNMEKNKIDQIIKKLNKVENTSNELPSNNNSTSPAKNKNETAIRMVKPNDYVKPSKPENEYEFESIIPVPPPKIDPILPPFTPTIDIRKGELENLKKALAAGDLIAAAKSYKLLKLFGYQEQADKILKENGYKVEEKDGEYTISKIEEKSKNENGETESNNPGDNGNEEEKPNDPGENNNNNNEVIAEEEEIVPEKPSEEEKGNSNNTNPTTTQNNTTNTTTNNNTTNNTNHNYSNNNYRPNSGNNAPTQNTATEVGSAEVVPPTEPEVVKPESEVKLPIEETNPSENKTNVVTIGDEPTSSKKSGLGSAIPIGLGTIAAGTAAVAGVRYIRNKHENQEEYDEEYDDENNNLDTEGEYVDSAQYDSGSSYMDDDYLGSTNDISSEGGYVDPTDLEESDDFSNDTVLEELNSNY